CAASMLRALSFRTLCLVIGMTAACGSEGDDPMPVSSLAQQDQEAVRSAPAAVEVAGTRFSLEALAWRDDMPGADDDGLKLATTLVATSGKMPAGVDLVRSFVVRGSEAWVPRYTNERRPTMPGRIE